MSFNFPLSVEVKGKTARLVRRFVRAVEQLADAATSTAAVYVHANGWGTPPEPTGIFTLQIAGELLEEENMFGLKGVLPQLKAGAPASRNYQDGGKITWRKNDAEQPFILTDRDQVDVAYNGSDPASPLAALKAELGDRLAAEFDFKDASGNLSGNPVRIAEFVLADTGGTPSPMEGDGEFKLGAGNEIVE